MPRNRDQIRGYCEEVGLEHVKKKLADGGVLSGAELGFAKEWVADQEKHLEQIKRENDTLEIARGANRIAKMAAASAVASAVASIAAVVIGGAS